ncbi:protoheme IX farnesyltransferase [bacterium]|nr:MAG: protoheme IX farnesyltransferase [bacterium]
MRQNSETLSLYSSSDILKAYWELTKPGITLMVLISMMIGYFLGSGLAGFDFLMLINASIGTFFTAAGTSAYNQYIERDLDKKMKRTSKRPLPLQKIGAANAILFSTGLIATGLTYLIFFVNPVAALVSAVTTILYLGFYTPLKRVSFLNVFVGSIPGALPPVGGWAAATGSVSDLGMWFLFAIVFLWQIPHVIAIAWLCNDDYCNAGFVMLPQNDKKGHISSLSAFASALLLIPVGIGMYFNGISSEIFLVGSIIAGLGFSLYAMAHIKEKTNVSAKKLMFASLIYLPVVWVIIVIDAIIL